MLSFTLLGHVELRRNGEVVGGFRSQKELALLIYLAQTGRTYQREHIAELLWDSHSTKQALSNLRTVLSRLQQQAGDALLVTQRSLALAPAMWQQVDSVRLPQALAGVGQIASAEHAAALQHALAAYRGDFVAGFQLRNAPRFDEWAATTREAIRRDVLAAYGKLGQYAAAAGDAALGIAAARRWIDVDALDETAHTLLLRLLIETGNMREASAHYEQYVQLLHTEWGIAPPDALAALIAEARPKRAIPPPPRSATRHNLPAAHDQFIGRTSIQHGIHMRLDQAWCRLVTVVGPGGVGKTRLATTVARQRASRYADGAWLVELADLDPNDERVAEAIAVEIAAVLDLRFTGSAAPAKQLLDHLQHKHVLLVLDNFEHLLHGSQLVLDIVQRCEYVQLLITSRQALQVRAEWALALGGLSYPNSDVDDAPAEATELFAARRAQQQWNALSAADIAAVRHICRVVEGLPLAIELAAALTGHATPQAIADRLQHGFDALQTTLRDVPQRHQSMQIVFDMSWRTLTPVLAQRLARLAVFHGGFTAAAAQHIADASVHHLAALAERSLVVHDPAADRYALHPVIRAYAAENLPAADQTQHAHARYYLALLAQYAEPLQKRRPQDSMALLEPEIDNLRLAWHTALGDRRADLLFAALPSLSTYYQLCGLAQEGEAVMRATVGAAAWGSTGAALMTRAGLEQARFQNRLGQYWPAMQTIQATLKQAAASADRWAEGMAHVLWAESLWRLGKYDAARSNLAHALSVAHAIDSTQLVGWCHHHLGIIDDIQGSHGAAHAHLHQACAAWQSLDNAALLCNSLNSIGLVCYNQGDLLAARQALQQALALCTQLDNRHMQALLLNNLSMIATEQDDHFAAQEYLQSGLVLAIASGNMTGQAEMYANLGRNHYLRGELDVASESLAQALQLAESLGNRALMALTMLSLAEVKRGQSDTQRAESLYHQALYIAQQDKLQRTECLVLIGLAELLSTTTPRQARQHSAEALALAETLGNADLIERATAISRVLHLSEDRTKQHLSA